MNRSTNAASDWTTFGRDLLVTTAGTTRGSWTAVLRDQLRTAIREGTLRPGVRLPATRSLAKDLGLSRGIIVSVYEQLGAEGYLESQPGSGTSVASLVQALPGRLLGTPGQLLGAPDQPRGAPGQLRGAPASQRRSTTPTITTGRLPDTSSDTSQPTLHTTGPGSASSPSLPTLPVREYRPRNPGLPDPNLFPRSEWLKAYRRAFQNLSDDDFRYGDPQGFQPLRAELADYLGRVRGIVATPDQILITNGYAEGLSIIACLIEDQKADASRNDQNGEKAALKTGVCIAVEEPGSSGTRQQLADWGCSTPPVKVDGQGLIVEELERTGATAALVTPAHQYPTGVVLSAERRIALLDWARKEPGRYIVEDDYDAEFRYDNVPVGSMQAMAPDLVITGSSVSKTLSPALRLGWLVLPPALVDEAVNFKTLIDLGTETPGQAAMAEFLRSGAFDRHVRRSRIFYRKKRQRILDTLADALPELTITGAKAGLSLCLDLTGPEPRGATRTDVDDVALAVRLKSLGVQCEALSNYSQLHMTQTIEGTTGPGRRPDSECEVGRSSGLVLDLATMGTAEVDHIIATLTPFLTNKS